MATKTEPPDIDILVRAGDWGWIDETRLRQAALFAWEAANAADADAGTDAGWNDAEAVDLAIVLGDDALLREMNGKFRKRDEPTDILSFPAQCFADARYQLGDVVLSEQGVLRGAKTRRRNKHDHLLHLVVHGVLHLCGYEHELKQQAERMESLEIKTLARMSINNPYTLSVA
ncbi:MAG: rRNA maturation RNase YbeY [Hyphomicrobiales bacterium]|nr:rRNA maturation RNase YbeY [Hyphomicrobiales bacterium]MCY4032939.1 rRNA maturation RNase YbeY [Hyphomicrobiales bacterium]MCY4039346.1 rRNA maturation RNase YbeY [Hyphomicrobiales bacterium]